MRARVLSSLCLVAAACGNTLVDHAADPTLLAGGSCGPGLASCVGACVPEDVNHCGDACLACDGTAPFANGVPACVAGACGFACADGFLLAGDACVRATAVSAGFGHTCAIAGGKVKCWGLNDHGQLGDGTTTDRPSPVDVALPGDASAITAGYVHTCAVVGAAKEVWCWGDNSTGALGDGTTPLSKTPVKVGGNLSGVDAIAAGGGANFETSSVTYYGHTCALVAVPSTSTHAVYCWGGNESGQLGMRNLASSATPLQVLSSSLHDATSLSVGDRHTCVVDSGDAWCWGANFFGQLGNGSTSALGTPTPDPQHAIASPSGGPTVRSAGAGAEHTCAVQGTTLKCWGGNSAGQVTTGQNGPNQLAAVAVPLDVQPSAVAGGGSHTCVVGAGGSVTCFGGNGFGQLGAPSSARGLVTVEVPAASVVTAGFAHTCALLQDGGIQCWGANDHGQLGDGTVTARPAPGYVTGR